MKKTILVIDDDYFMQKLLEVLLKNEGHLVFAASNPEEAYKIISAQPIDIITCDVFMPDVDVFSFIETVKSSPALSEIPIIIITAASNHPRIQSTLGSGVCCIVEKPFNIQTVRSAIEKAISAQRDGY